MSIENEIFKKYMPDFNKIETHGFIKKNDKYILVNYF